MSNEVVVQLCQNSSVVALYDDTTIRIANTRVNLRVLVREFYKGGTLEYIQESYPSLTLFQDFIERYGSLVGIKEDYGLISIWNFEGPSLYQQALNNMSLIAERASIKNVFVTGLDYLGKHERTIQNTQSYIAYEDRYLSVVNQTVTTKKGREHFRVCARNLGWNKVYRYGNKESNRTVYKERFKANKELFDNTVYNLGKGKALLESLDKNRKKFLEEVLLLITSGMNVSVGKKEDAREAILEDFIELQKDYYFNIGNKRDAYCWHHAPKVEAYLKAVSSIEKELVNT